jgi:hypothetical protein
MSFSAPGSLVVTLLQAAGAHTHLRISAFSVCIATHSCRLCSDMCMLTLLTASPAVTGSICASTHVYMNDSNNNKRAQAGRLRRKPVSVDAPALLHCPCAGFPGQWCVSLTHARAPHARARPSGEACLDRSR